MVAADVVPRLESFFNTNYLKVTDGPGVRSDRDL